jgi:hypothetical protein
MNNLDEKTPCQLDFKIYKRIKKKTKLNANFNLIIVKGLTHSHTNYKLYEKLLNQNKRMRLLESFFFGFF